MKKKSLFFPAALLMLLTSGYYVYWQTKKTSNDAYAEYVILREKQALAYLDLGRSVGETKKIDRLPDIFKRAIDQRQFDWYMISYLGSPVFYYPDGMRNLKFLEVEDNVFVNNEISYKTIKLADGSYLTVGINKNPEKYFGKVLEKYSRAMLQDLLVPIILALLIFGYFLKDILVMIKAVSTGKSVKNEKVSLFSKEAETLNRALSGVEYKIDSLEQQRLRLSQQVLPSLSKEIFSGRKPPYEFDCTMVRTDINGFSELFLQGDREVLIRDVKSLFRAMTEIVSRYGGYVHEFIGDEIIFYFKDEEHLNSTASALACLRDFEQFATEFGKYRTKSSLAHGTLHFSDHVNGYNLSGTVLIETVRLLFTVKERENFTTHFSDSILNRLPKWCEFESLGEMSLKGYEKKNNIYHVTKLLPLNEWVKSEDFKITDYVHFKSDPDISFPLEHLKNIETDEEYLQFKFVFSQFGKSFADLRTMASKSNYSNFLKYLLEQQSFEKARIALTALPFYIGKNEFVATDQIMILNFLKILTPSGQVAIFKSLINLGFNGLSSAQIELRSDRAFAYSLLYRGRIELSKSVVDNILKFSKSEILSYERMAMFLAFSLTRYWNEKDSIQLQVHGKALLKLVDKYNKAKEDQKLIAS